MARNRFLASLPLLVVLALALSAVASIPRAQAVDSKVYLTPSSTGATVWDGTCSTDYLSTHCTSASPCSLPKDVTVTGSEQCALYWGSQSDVFAGPGEHNIVAGPSTLQLLNYFSGTYHSLTINITVPLTSLISQTKSNISGCTFNIFTSTTTRDGNNFETYGLASYQTFFNLYHTPTGNASNLSIQLMNSNLTAKAFAPEADALISIYALGTPDAGTSISHFLLTNVQATIDSHPVIYSELDVASLGVSSYSLIGTGFSTPTHLIWLTNPTKTSILVTNRAFIVASVALVGGPALGDNFNAEDAISLSLIYSEVSGSTPLPGATPKLATLQQGACMHINADTSSITNMIVNCNHNESTSTAVRCSVTAKDSEFRNNRFCMLGPIANHTSAVPAFRNTRFLLQSSFDGQTDTIMRNIAVNAQTVTFSNQFSLTSPAGARFEGNVDFTSDSNVTFDSIYTADNAVVTLGNSQFSRNVRMASGSRIQGLSSDGQSTSSWSFSGLFYFDKYPLSLATTDASTDIIVDWSNVRAIIEPPSGLVPSPNAPVLAAKDIIFTVHNLTSFILDSSIQWDLGQPQDGGHYRFGTFVSTVAVDAAFLGAQIKMTGNSASHYSFAAVITAATGQSASTYDVDFVSTGLVPVEPVTPTQPLSPTAAPIAAPPTASPVTVPSVTPVNAPIPVSLQCNGSVSGAPNFTCEHGVWTYRGNLTINDDMIINSVTRPVHVIGSLNFTSDNDLRLVGPSSGIQVQDCLHFDAGRIVFDYSKNWPKGLAQWNQTALLQHVNCSKVPILLAPPVNCIDTIPVITQGAYNETIAVHFTITYQRCKIMIGVSIACAVCVVLAVLFATWMILYYRRKHRQGYEAINK